MILLMSSVLQMLVNRMMNAFYHFSVTWFKSGELFMIFHSTLTVTINITWGKFSHFLSISKNLPSSYPPYLKLNFISAK